MTGGVALLVVGMALVAAALGLARTWRWPRIAATSAGALCVSSAAILLLTDDGRPPSGPVSETLIDALGSDQVSEEVRVFIDGRDVGVIRVDERAPTASLVIRVPQAGLRDFRTVQIQELRTGKRTRRTYESRVVIDGKGRLEIRSSPPGANVQPAD